jgi:hypothetical protein
MLHSHAERLKGCAAMGGFVVSDKEAEQAVLAYEKKKAEGRRFTFDQSLAEINQRAQVNSGR